MCGVAAFMAAICIWSLYDGFVAWPNKNSEFERTRPALQGTNLMARAWIAKTGENGRSPLDLIFSQQGLKTPSKLVKKIDEHKMADNLPQDLSREERERERVALAHIFSEPLYSSDDLQGQVVMAAIAALVAGWILLLVTPRISKVFVADQNGLHGSGFGGISLKYADIESMDWKLWDKKGIVRVKINNGALFILDGWHYKGIGEIVKTIVEHRPDLVGATCMSSAD